MDYTDVDHSGVVDNEELGAKQKVAAGLNKVKSCFSDRRIILVIVFVALFLDNMLLTVVVPIIPDFLLDQRRKNKTLILQEVLEEMNNSCEGLFAPSFKKDESRLPIFASRGHSPHQHVAVMMEQIYDSDAAKEFNLESFLTLLEKVNLSTPTQPIAYVARIRGCRQNATNYIRELRKKTVGQEHMQIGLMFASKAVVQLLVNPMVGPLTNRIGYSIPMFSGFMIMFTSTIVFAFGSSYGILFVARALQGVGSACSSVSGMGMLATVYTDDKERSHAFSWALSGIALGVLVGPPFGGMGYQFINKEAPFLILAALALFDGALQLIALKPAVRPEAERGSSLAKLLRDPYILIAAGSITFGNMGIAMLEPTLPLWMWEKMRAQGWQQGMAFLPCSISYLIGTNIFGPIAHRIGRGISAGLGMTICGVCLIAIPFSTIMEHLIVPMFGLGFAIGMVDSSMMPIMGHLVDLRHVAVYGSVYAIADVAFCLGFAIGPILSGSMVQTVGFSWMLWSISIVCLLYSPLTLLLRNPPGKDETAVLVERNQGNHNGRKNVCSSESFEASRAARMIPTLPLGSTLGYDPTAGGDKSYGYY
ncbi:unnamed protein product [Dicrocoelium dendriticum]|nr:unnamed protein product [Dicrocoelium dendriticum]